MAEGGGGALRELLAVFDIKLGGEKEIEGTIKELKEGFMSLGEVILGAFAVEKITDFAKEMIEMGEKLYDTSVKLGVSTDELQKFQGALTLSGVSADEASGIFFKFTKAIAGAAGGNEEAAKTFAKLHVKVKDGKGNLGSTIDLLEGVADGLKGIENPTQRNILLMHLFGKSGAKMNQMLGNGAEGIKELYKEVEESGGIIDSGFIAESKKAGDELKKWDMASRGLKVSLLSEFMPAIIKGIKFIRDWVRAITQFVKSTYVVQTALISLAALGITKVAFALKDLAKTFGLFKEGNTLASLFSMGEIGLIIAAVTALYLLFDDLFTLFSGGDSEIGDVLVQFLGFDKANKIVGDLKKAWDDITAAIDLSGISVGTFTNALEAVVLAMVVLVEWWVVLVDIISLVLDTVVMLGKEIYDLLGLLGAFAKGEDTTAWTKEMDKDFKAWGKDLHKNIEGIGVAGGNAIDIAGQIPGAISGNSKVDQTNHMNFTFNGNVDEDMKDGISNVVIKAVTDANGKITYNRVYAAGASRAPG